MNTFLIVVLCLWIILNVIVIFVLDDNDVISHFRLQTQSIAELLLTFLVLPALIIRKLFGKARKFVKLLEYRPFYKWKFKVGDEVIFQDNNFMYGLNIGQMYKVIEVKFFDGEERVLIDIKSGKMWINSSRFTLSTPLQKAMK